MTEEEKDELRCALAEKIFGERKPGIPNESAACELFRQNRRDPYIPIYRASKRAMSRCSKRLFHACLKITGKVDWERFFRPIVQSL
jgi:hypothetical protein